MEVKTYEQFLEKWTDKTKVNAKQLWDIIEGNVLSTHPENLPSVLKRMEKEGWTQEVEMVQDFISCETYRLAKAFHEEINGESLTWAF